MSSTIDDKYNDYYDILDEANFNTFKEKMKKWDCNLNDSANSNSVFSRLFGLLYYHYLYKTVIGLHKKSIDYPNNELGFNNGIANLIAEGYVHLQTITIRSLIEHHSQNPERMINSLRSIVDDIEENYRLITRECYLAIGNLPYNHREARHAFNTYNPSVTFGVRNIPSKGPFAYPQSIIKHELFDKISDSSENNRNRTDTIRADIFRKLKERFGSCSFIKDFVNTNFAHYSITTPINQQNQLPFDRVEKCIIQLYKYVFFR